MWYDSVKIHEFRHKLMDDFIGDVTARRSGSVRLNPIEHADPIGTLLLPVVGGIYAANGGIGGFGWGKPVQWNPSRIPRKWKMSPASILVAIAGPSLHLVLGSVPEIVREILDCTHGLSRHCMAEPNLRAPWPRNVVL